ncbi:hypothetical protein POV27_16180 [Aureisphaera galaxeae]|uniref:hypothetical protein n=1 Tax=Aureisphaera galaxeae TaxID=1538023 RepID=UPI00234FEF0F|nr:hypothetical protein [Aureisphaera galaxeae]MDC8005598.1 hypothetical protein [Aureisphaera galaxeae]
MKKNLLIPALCVFGGLLFFSCVKDTDFDEAENVAATPVVELNLIHFNVGANEFYDTITNTPRLILTDTTEIRFLDDTEIQESLLRADFLFRFRNSIPRTFVVDFQFLSEQNEITYATSTTVPAGTEQIPATPPDFIQVVEGDDIALLTQANKVVANVTIPSADADLVGNLNLQSKTTYYLEIKERN